MRIRREGRCRFLAPWAPAVGAVAAIALVATALASPPPPTPRGAQVLKRQYVELIALVGQEPLVRGSEAKGAVEIRIQPGYHVNANPPSEDWLIPTEVTVSGAPGVTVRKAFYPHALERTFEFWSEPLRVYEGNVVTGFLLAVSEQAELGPHDLVVKVRYQACNEEACFAPVDATYSVPTTVAAAGTAVQKLESPLLQRARFEDSEAQ